MISVRASTASVRISEVNEEIFKRCFHARCLDINFCHDACCSHGCDVDIAEVERIMSYRRELEPLLNVPASEWFSGVTSDKDYPSGAFARARDEGGRCIFYDTEIGGCILHRFAVEEGLNAHQLKPMVCFLFPITWGNGKIFVSDFLDELPCKNHGPSVFEVQKSEMGIYLGREIVSELEALAPERHKYKKIV